MAIILNQTDFVADYSFQFDGVNNSTWVQDIDVYEKLYLIQIMGQSLYNAFETNPGDARWDDLKDPFVLDGRNCRGLKKCLLAFVYSELIRSDGVKNAKSSNKTKGEVNIQADIQGNYARSYNAGCTDAHLIQNKIQGDLTAFPEFSHCDVLFFKKVMPW